jgi:NAD+ synthase
MHLLSLDPRATTEHLCRFLRESVHSTGLDQVVLGLSGGIDSALAAALAVRALGADKVHVACLPWRASNPASLADAQCMAEHLGLSLQVVDISPMVDAFATTQQPDPLRLGNIMARVRMTVLFDLSARHGALVLGTSNKTELLLGYGTWYGDLASAVNPLGDLYKQQVFQLSRDLGLPARVIDKAPSADLEEGQTDEADLGWSYETIDRVLVRAIDQRRTVDSLVAEGFARDTVEGILARVRRFHFKRNLPVIPKISSRTLGLDWLYCRDAGR